MVPIVVSCASTNLGAGLRLEMKFVVEICVNFQQGSCIVFLYVYI